MIKRVLFVYLNQDIAGYAPLRGKPNRSVRRRPQLGFQYLAAVLEDKGIESIILDQSIEHFDIDGLVGKIDGLSVDMVGFYTATSLKENVVAYISGLKHRIDTPILVGGPGTIHASDFLKAGCDIVCTGEGETTIQNIIDYYNGNKKLQDINGIAFKEDGRIVTNPRQKLIADLDSIPFPRRDMDYITHHHDYYIPTMKKPYVTMISSRGCPMKCTYCTSHIIWEKKARLRSVENVLAEIDYLKKTIDVKYIAFLDDIFGFKNSWLEEFCTKLAERKYNINWMCIQHPFSVRKDRRKLLGLMKDAGCDTISFGLQSAHPEILKNIKRHPDEPLELEKTIRAAKELGFLTSVSFIFGLPGETTDSIKKTIDYCCRVRPAYVEFFNLELLEGSEIRDTFKKKENVCDIDKDEIDLWCKRAARRFYAHPKQVMHIFNFGIKNPSWFGVLLKHSAHFIKNIGF